MIDFCSIVLLGSAIAQSLSPSIVSFGTILFLLKGSMELPVFLFVVSQFFSPVIAV